MFRLLRRHCWFVCAYVCSRPPFNRSSSVFSLFVFLDFFGCFHLFGIFGLFFKTATVSYCFHSTVLGSDLFFILSVAPFFILLLGIFLILRDILFSLYFLKFNTLARHWERVGCNYRPCSLLYVSRFRMGGRRRRYTFFIRLALYIIPLCVYTIFCSVF